MPPATKHSSMLVAWLWFMPLCVVLVEADIGCGPNVVPMTIIPTKPCTLRASRDMLDVSDEDLSLWVQQGLENGAKAAKALIERERRVTNKWPVRIDTPEYHHYLTNVANNDTIQQVEAALNDLAVVTTIAKTLTRKTHISPQAAGDLLISLKIKANSSMAQQTPECNASSIYRTFDGSCNNLEYPTWGMTNTPFTRIAKSKFHDGINEPRKSTTGKELPNSRILRLKLLPNGVLSSRKYSLMQMQYGQAIAHDVALSADQIGASGFGIQCCTYEGAPLPYKDQSIACLPVKISKLDPYYSHKGITCMSIARSTKSFVVGGNYGPAETVNSVNHLMDGSFIYGNDKEKADQLREFSGGRLREQTLPDGRKVLPQDNDPVASCSLKSANETCFVAGDFRVNQNTELTVIQILWLREHNRVADKLSAMNPHWDDEKLYQETRRFVIAEHENIAFTEFLPTIIDEELLEKYGLKPPKTGYSGCYNSSINPSTLHEFTEAIYRIFHGIAKSNLEMYQNVGCPVGHIRLGEWMDKPEIIVEGNNLDQFVRGLTEQSAKKADKTTVYELTNNLFRVDTKYGQDLDTFDITRSRDNGLPTLNDIRELTGLRRAKNFADFSDTMSLENAYALAEFYENTDDVDLMMVMLEERGTKDLNVHSAIILDQFYRWKCGDRFFFDIGDAPHSFTKDQLNQIRTATISRIICDNADNIDYIQPNSFKRVSEENKVTHCDNLPAVNLSYWKEIH